MVLAIITGSIAGEAAVCLSADADDIADLDVARGLRPDTDSNTNNLMANDGRVGGRTLWITVRACHSRTTIADG